MKSAFEEPKIRLDTPEENQQEQHLCLFYDHDPGEQMPVLLPLIQEALGKDEQFIYIADDQTGDELAGRLEQSGMNVGDECSRGRLRLWSRQEWRQPGALDPGKKSLQVRQFVNEALAAGFNGVRFAVEMTWTLGPDISAEELERWEATLNAIFVPDFPGWITCQYNRSRLSPETLLAALHTHPLTVIEEQLCPNLFYQAPLILSGNAERKGKKFQSAKVEWMLGQLKRARATQAKREESFRKSAEETLRLSEERFRLAAYSDAITLYEQDLDLRYTWLYPAHPEHSGALGKTDEEILPNEEGRLLNQWKREVLKNGATQRREIRATLPTGIRFYDLFISSRRNQKGEITGLAGASLDITERKKAEEALREAKEQLARSNADLEKQVRERTAELTETNSHLEAFVYSIAHDLRAPLRSMQGFASMLLEEYASKLDETAQDYARRIAVSSERMDRLVLDLLDYGRVARAEILLTSVSVETAWVAAVAHNEQTIREKQAQIEVPSPLPEVKAHQATLAQVLGNLLSNALKFVGPGVIPKILFRAEERADCIRLWVEDNGIGIAPENHEYVFRVFERLHGHSYPGNGIGLSIVRKGVERMSGRVGLESVSGQGARFWIELPKA